MLTAARVWQTSCVRVEEKNFAGTPSLGGFNIGGRGKEQIVFLIVVEALRSKKKKRKRKEKDEKYHACEACVSAVSEYNNGP